MSVPIPSADLSQPDAGGALAGWEQLTAVTPRSHVPHASTPAPTEAVASESLPPVEPQSDSELLSAFVQRRDADAFTEIVQRYRLLVYRVALRAVDDRHLADDVFQATFLVLAQSAHKIKHAEVLAAWLHGTARNIARRAMGNQYAEQKQLKEWAKQTLAQKGEEMATSTDVDPFEELARRNEQQLLDEELQQLPESSRAPLVLFYLEKKTQAEIAQIMGLSVDAVEGRLKRAKQELRTRLIRRGVLLSTVVAAATVLTPSITLAAPAASLVSTTVTTALGTAALGSTALGATAVTGAATSSKLAAGSATATSLAAQEVAIMSVTSKATAMLITTAASTTLISGLVLGGMVGMFSVGAGGSAPTGSQSIDSQVDLQGVINESSEPGLISPTEDDQVQFALVEPEQQKEGAEQPAVKTEPIQEEMKAVTYQLADLNAEQLVKAAECAISLSDKVSVHETTQSLVIRATQENHKQIAKQVSALRSRDSHWKSDQFRLVLERGRLTKLMKEFDESHPDVKELRGKIAALEKSIAEGTENSVVVEEQAELLGHPDKAPNGLRSVTYPLVGIDAEKLQDIVAFAESLPGSASLDGASHSLVVNDTSENQDRISGYLTKLREGQETELKNKVEILAARKRLAAKVKELGRDHPEVRKAQFAASNLERDIAEKSQGTQSAEKFPITTTIFEADDEAIKQIADSDAEGKLTLKKEARKKFDSLAWKKKVMVIGEPALVCRVGQPSRFFNGGECLLEPAPEDAIWVGQKLESVEFGDIGQVTVLDKISRDGQRVLKYELEYTKTYYGNIPKYEGNALPLSFGQVFRGYAMLPDPRSEGTLIGPVGMVEKTSTEGGTREVRERSRLTCGFGRKWSGFCLRWKVNDGMFGVSWSIRCFRVIVSRSIARRTKSSGIAETAGV